MKILLDTNVIVDVLQKREPMFEDASKIILAVAENRLEGYITAKEITDIHYLARKLFAGQEGADGKARRVIEKLLSFLVLLDTRAEDCKAALSIPNNDFEDAVMMATAIRSEMNGIVTRNEKDFAPCPIPIYTPKNFLHTFL